MAEGSSNNANVDTSRSERAVWLMKCPPVVSRSLSSSSASDSLRPVAKVIVSLDPLLANDDDDSPPQVLYLFVFYIFLYVFSLYTRMCTHYHAFLCVDLFTVIVGLCGCFVLRIEVFFLFFWFFWCCDGFSGFGSFGVWWDLEVNGMFGCGEKVEKKAEKLNFFFLIYAFGGQHSVNRAYSLCKCCVTFRVLWIFCAYICFWINRFLFSVFLLCSFGVAFVVFDERWWSVWLLRES